MNAKIAAALSTFLCLFVLTLQSLGSAGAAPDAAALNAHIGRGINLGNALDAPHEGAWGVTLEQGDFERVARAGFDSVRLPVRWSAHMAEQPPFTIDPEFLSRVDRAIEQALERDLTVIVNAHHFEELYLDPESQKQRFLALWRQLAAHYQHHPQALYFEVLNEPHAELDAGRWNAYLAAAIDVIRPTNPNRALVVGPANWNNFEALDQLELPAADRRLIVTVHYYNPFQFTHQGAAWVGGQSAAWLGTPWPDDGKGAEQIQADFRRIQTWAERHQRPIFIGEFGAYEKADPASRARWTKAVVDAATKAGFTWAYWEYCSGFGIYDKKLDQWRSPLVEALGVEVPFRGR